MVGKVGPSDMFTIILEEEDHENSYQSYATYESNKKWG
jgi:hypothetical protein